MSGEAGDSGDGFSSEGIFNEEGGFGDLSERYASEETGVTPEFLKQNFEGKNIGQVAKMLKDNQTMARGKAVVYPGAEASDEDRAHWNRAAGVPEEVAQMLPEDMEGFTKATGWTEETATPVIQSLIDAGAPGPVIAAGIAGVQAASEAQIAAWESQAAAAHEADMMVLADKWGADSDTKLAAAATAAGKLAEKTGLDAEAVEGIKEGIKGVNNLGLTMMMANLADMMREAELKGPGKDPAGDAFRTPRDLANAIMQDENHHLHKAYRGGDQKIHDAIDEILTGDEAKGKAAAAKLKTYR